MSVCYMRNFKVNYNNNNHIHHCTINPKWAIKSVWCYNNAVLDIKAKQEQKQSIYKSIENILEKPFGTKAFIF
jgi:hypothetical protein